MAAAIPKGIAQQAVTSITHKLPTHDDKIPDFSGNLEGKFIKKSVEIRPQPERPKSKIRAVKVARQNSKQRSPTIAKIESLVFDF